METAVTVFAQSHPYFVEVGGLEDLLVTACRARSFCSVFPWSLTSTAPWETKHTCEQSLGRNWAAPLCQLLIQKGGPGPLWSVNSNTACIATHLPLAWPWAEPMPVPGSWANRVQGWLLALSGGAFSNFLDGEMCQMVTREWGEGDTKTLRT